MKFRFKNLIGWTAFKLMVLLLLVIFTFAYTLPWIVNNSLDQEYSGVDFHAYWYAGHFVRQGINSFAAILNDPSPSYWNPQILGSGDPQQESESASLLILPIYYLDGHVASVRPVAQMMIATPAVTAPLNLLMGLLSWFSWPTARLTWMILNLIFAITIPWLALRLLPEDFELHLLDKLIFVFVFYSFYGLRQSVVVGQQTLISLFLLILALLSRKNWLVSGILLGIGISKYSVGLPVFLYFLTQKQYRSLLTSLTVQAVGLIVLLPLKMGSLLDTIMAYLKVFSVNYLQEGVHLSARFPADSRLPLILIILILGAGIYFLSRLVRPSVLSIDVDYIGLHQLNLITLVVFLTTYHRVHDAPFIIFYLLLIICILFGYPTMFRNQISALLFFSYNLIVTLLLLTPFTFVKMINFLPEGWNTVDGMTSIAFLLILGLSSWILISQPLSSKVQISERQQS